MTSPSSLRQARPHPHERVERVARDDEHRDLGDRDGPGRGRLAREHRLPDEVARSTRETGSSASPGVGTPRATAPLSTKRSASGTTPSGSTTSPAAYRSRRTDGHEGRHVVRRHLQGRGDGRDGLLDPLGRHERVGGVAVEAEPAPARGVPEPAAQRRERRALVGGPAHLVRDLVGGAAERDGDRRRAGPQLGQAARDPLQQRDDLGGRVVGGEGHGRGDGVAAVAAAEVGERRAGERRVRGDLDAVARVDVHRAPVDLRRRGRARRRRRASRRGGTAARRAAAARRRRCRSRPAARGRGRSR